jgi:hypothetical protein
MTRAYTLWTIPKTRNKYNFVCLFRIVNICCLLGRTIGPQNAGEKVTPSRAATPFVPARDENGIRIPADQGCQDYYLRPHFLLSACHAAKLITHTHTQSRYSDIRWKRWLRYQSGRHYIMRSPPPKHFVETE